METWLVVTIGIGIYFAIMAGFARYVANAKNRPVEEALCFILFLGPFGLLLIACLPMGTATEDWAAQQAHYQSQLDRVAKAEMTDMGNVGMRPETKRQARRLLGELKDGD